MHMMPQRLVRALFSRLVRALFSRYVSIAVSLNHMITTKHSLCLLVLTLCKIFHNTYAKYHQSKATVSYFISCKQLMGNNRLSCHLLLMKWKEVPSLDRTLVNFGVISIILKSPQSAMHGRIGHISIWESTQKYVLLLRPGSVTLWGILKHASLSVQIFHSDQTMQNAISQISSPRSPVLGKFPFYMN